MDDFALAKLEAELRQLLSGEYSSLTIAFNEQHAANYATAQRWHDEWGMYGGGADHDHVTWVSEEERVAALACNSVWTCHWYPNTPVGFNCIGASSLPALISALRKGFPHG